MSVVTQLYFQIFEENNYMFRPFSGWVIIRLRLEYRRKLPTKRTSRMGERDLVLQCLGRCVAIYTGCGIWDSYDFICRVLCGFIDMWAGVVSDDDPPQKRAETCICFLQQFENTVVLRRTFIHLISTSTESHNGDDATKDYYWRQPVIILYCFVRSALTGSHCNYIQNFRWKTPILWIRRRLKNTAKMFGEVR
jgi:hypothetical protein